MATVKLLNYTPNAEKIIAAAAKLCYSPSSIEDVMDNITDEGASKFVNMLASYGHESPMEHISFTFGIEGVSRAFLAQITRHRMASYSVQSQRYVAEMNFEYVTPPEIEGDEKAKEIFIKSMERIGEDYCKLTEILKAKHVKELVEAGQDEKTADKNATKMAIEDARFVLPNACDTKMIVTMNARGLMNFFSHRLCNRAQWEIRDVATKMYELVYGIAPSVFDKAGPACLYGGCSEGAMSCKKQREVREHYLKIKSGASK